jgi:hypothetical protein
LEVNERRWMALLRRRSSAATEEEHRTQVLGVRCVSGVSCRLFCLPCRLYFEWALPKLKQIEWEIFCDSCKNSH